ncbi:hypothetical protein ACIBL8_47220 [Streptomyces sp. NPDC050523]|uniref:hypothetical protein n=1 Tax=Streptomyces sp. NPDC050523 TaxID=3365622 RepID=UPI0037B355DB
MTVPEASRNAVGDGSAVRREFALERYRYILQQIHTVNENLHRFLAIYQTLATSLVAGVVALFVGYRKWGIAADTARGGVIGLLVLTTVVAAFTATCAPSAPTAPRHGGWPWTICATWTGS